MNQNQQLLHILIFVVLFSVPAVCQIPGPPPNPEFFSAMSAVWQQVPLEPPRPASKPKGSVAELIWEQFHSDSSDRTKATNLSERQIIRYDEQQREVERIASDSVQGREAKTKFIYQNGRLESQTTQFSKSGKSE